MKRILGSSGWGWLGVFGLFAVSAARGDIYHYKNIFVGERASGLGGAFVAISDDPSGIYYNPAGMVFSMENYFSLSANAYSVTHQQFSNIVPGQNYGYNSQRIIPVFFGFTQSYGKNRLGIAVIMPNSDLIDQDDTINGLYSGAGNPGIFKRRFFQNDETYLFGPAFARELAQNFTIGLSFMGVFRTMKTIDNQYVQFNPQANQTDSKYFIQNVSLSRTSFALHPKLGLQYMPSPKLSLGLTGSKNFNLGGSGNGKVLKTVTSTDSSFALNGLAGHDLQQLDLKLQYDLPSPMELSAGSAYFFSKEFLLTAQFDYSFADSSYSEFPVVATWNAALGAEYFLSSVFVVRGGFFTNNAKTANVDSSATNQAPHVNLYGTSLSLALAKPGSSLSIGTSYMLGTGEGQAIGDTNLVQKVSQDTLTFFLAGSYQL